MNFLENTVDTDKHNNLSYTYYKRQCRLDKMPQYRALINLSAITFKILLLYALFLHMTKKKTVI